MSHPIKHFITISKHRNKVISHCFKVGIGLQGMFHDMSKYGLTEFRQGAKHYQGTRSPNEQERDLYGYSIAWMHHKGRNKHHFEYWVDLDPKTRKYRPVPMPLNFVAEMFCDRVAASKIYKGKDYTDASSLEYYIWGGAREKMHSDTADILEGWLKMLAEQGERATFAQIRAELKEYKKSKKKKKQDKL